MIVQLVSVMVARVSRSSDDGSVAAEPHAAPGASAASVALGASLRGARENRGLSVQQVADQTRIPRRHLESLECGDLDAVPAGPYRRGEVLAFAHTVGMDRDEALRQLAHALAPVDVPRIEPTRQVPARVGTMGGWLMVATLALVAVGGATFWPHRSTPPAGELGASIAPAAVSPNLPQPTPTTGVASTSVLREPLIPEQSPLPEAAAVPDRFTPIPSGPDRSAAALEPDEQSLQPAVVATAAGNAARLLVVETTPAGARVTVDGVGWGSTPVSIPHLSPGARRIRLTREGYATVERSVTLAAEGTTTVRLTLE